MIYDHVNSEDYISEFLKKFENFGAKAPIVISVYHDELGVTIIHENSKKKYFYAWDYSMPVKSFIFNIKKDLSDNHYPRICRKVELDVPVTPEKHAELMAAGTSAKDLPTVEHITKTETYRIDKVIVMKNEFIIVNEETREQFCYRMDRSCLYFLKDYREGAFTDLYDAGETFFKKSELVNKLSNLAQ